MELLFKKIKIAFPKAIVQFEKKYVSFTFGGGIYYQLRVQKDKVRMMATNYPQKAKIGVCLRIIKKHGIEDLEVNGNRIIFEVGVRNPEIFTLRIEMPYNSGQLEKDSFNNGVVDSCAKFHEILLPLVNNFMKQPVGDLYALMGGTNNTSPNKTKAAKAAPPKAQKSSSSTIQRQIASAIVQMFPDAEIKKIDKDNYLDIHLPSVNPKKGTHLGVNTAKGLIKIVFYSREESFNEQVLSNSKKIEAYAHGLRIEDNPTYNTVEKAIEAAINFVLEIKRTTQNASKGTKPASVKTESKKLQLKERVVKSSKEGSDFEEMIKAYKKGDLEKVAEYIEKGCPILQFSQDESLIENELLTVCVADPVDLKLLKKIIKRGDDLNIQNNDSDKYTAVHYCAWDGKAEALSILLKNGALPDIVGEDGRTALHLAAANGFVEIVELLLKAGAHIDRRIPNDFNKYYSNDGSTAIREALYNQNWDVIELLKKNGADLKNLTEPCCQSLEGTNDLFEVIRISNEEGLYPNGNFNQTKLNELEKEIRGDSNQKEDAVDYFELLKRNLSTNTEDLTKAVLGQEDNTINLDDFDVNEDSVIKYICDKIKREKYLTNLLYVNRSLDTKGYTIDNHQTYFFDSSVLISDKEMQGFLVVNMDGFYSNCVNEDEMQMIFSWSSVNDIEYDEDGDDCSIDIVADQGRLTIKKEGSHSLKILDTFYKHVWKIINDKFKDESIIIWNDVWKMGIKPIGFSEFLDYYTFDVSQEEKEEVDSEEREEVEESVVDELDDEKDKETYDESDNVEEEESEYDEFIVTLQSSLTDDKIEYLISKDKILCLGSVTSITDRQAELLSKSKKYIYLDGLTSLTDNQAVAFSKFRGSGINLDGIESFSDRQVEIISNHEGGLSLDGIISLSDNHAAKIASHKGDLSLDGLTALSDKQAEYLSKHQGELSLDGVTYISDKQAALLANHDGDLFLDSLNNLNDIQAKIFSKHFGALTLNGITSLTDNQINLLSKHQGSLSLNGLVSLSDKSLEILGSQKGEYLSLNGLTSLSREGAIALARYEGDLHLDGITTLSDQAALALTMHEGELSMNGLTSLTDRAKEVLAEKGISISLDDSDEVEDDIVNDN